MVQNPIYKIRVINSNNEILYEFHFRSFIKASVKFNEIKNDWTCCNFMYENNVLVIFYSLKNYFGWFVHEE